MNQIIILLLNNNNHIIQNFNMSYAYIIVYVKILINFNNNII